MTSNLNSRPSSHEQISIQESEFSHFNPSKLLRIAAFLLIWRISDSTFFRAGSSTKSVLNSHKPTMQSLCTAHARIVSGASVISYLKFAQLRVWLVEQYSVCEGNLARESNVHYMRHVSTLLRHVCGSVVWRAIMAYPSPQLSNTFSVRRVGVRILHNHFGWENFAIPQHSLYFPSLSLLHSFIHCALWLVLKNVQSSSKFEYFGSVAIID